jgi:predicted nucleic acid-binding protein
LSYLLDTNVISELRKGKRCNLGVASWFANLLPAEFYLSALTIGEIQKGIESIRRRDKETADALDLWLAEIRAAYSDRILPVDEAVAEEWVRFNSSEFSRHSEHP